MLADFKRTTPEKMNTTGKQRMLEDTLTTRIVHDNTSNNTLTDISDDRIAFSKIPDIPKHLEVEQTEVLIKVRNK